MDLTIQIAAGLALLKALQLKLGGVLRLENLQMKSYMPVTRSGAGLYDRMNEHTPQETARREEITKQM